jgi:hypothetical protein
MAEHILSLVPLDTLQARVAAATAAYATATEQLAEAQRQLAAHENSDPALDPGTWAAQKRTLSDTVPVFEALAMRAKHDLAMSERALEAAIRQQIGALRAEIAQQTKAAMQHNSRRAAELEAEANRLRANRSPESTAVTAVSKALHQAERDLEARYWPTAKYR